MSVQERKRLKSIRSKVIKRDGLVCCYCDKVLTLQTVTLDHIVPDSKQGTFNATNLTPACAPCNNKRGNENFFEFAQQYNFPSLKTEKYKRLYSNNLKIKVLNIAKSQCISNDYEVPQDLIKQACSILKIQNINYDEFIDNESLILDAFQKRKEIIYAFEQLILLIEAKS
jgi:hypothetical protein